MNSPKTRRWNERVEYVVVQRDGVSENGQQEGAHATPTPTTSQMLSRLSRRRQQPTATDDEDDSDDDDAYGTTSTTAMPSSGLPPPVRMDCEKHTNMKTDDGSF